MPHLHRLSDMSRNDQASFEGAGMNTIVGVPAVMGQNTTLGTVRDALVDDDQGKLRYLLVDTDGGSVEGALLLPIGLARIADGRVYFDDLTQAQVTALHRYSSDEDYTFDLQRSDERVLRGSELPVSAGAATDRYDYRDTDQNDKLFRAPQTLQLIEERLQVSKQRMAAGSVEIGKHVETRTEKVEVPLEREELVIERHAVTDARPVDGDIRLGAGSETLQVELEAERATVNKQAFVAEEVEIGKRVVHETQTVSETVGREVLDVQQTGEVKTTTEDLDRTNRK